MNLSLLVVIIVTPMEADTETEIGLKNTHSKLKNN